MASAAHLVATVRQLLEEGSIKGDSIGPNEMYACHYAPTLAGEQPCYCKTPLASGLGSQGGNRRWNATIAPGKTMASGLTERGMQASAYEQDSAFTLHGLDFAGVVYAGDSAIANARAKGVVFEDYHEYPEQSQIGGYMNIFDWGCGVNKPFDTFISIGKCHRRSKSQAQ